jgi:hypothetical protein
MYHVPPLACFVVDEYGTWVELIPGDSYKAALYFYGIAQFGVHLEH